MEQMCKGIFIRIALNWIASTWCYEINLPTAYAPFTTSTSLLVFSILRLKKRKLNVSRDDFKIKEKETNWTYKKVCGTAVQYVMGVVVDQYFTINVILAIVQNPQVMPISERVSCSSAVWSIARSRSRRVLSHLVFSPLCKTRLLFPNPFTRFSL